MGSCNYVGNMNIYREREEEGKDEETGDEQGEAESGERADGKLQGIPDGG